MKERVVSGVCVVLATIALFLYFTGHDYRSTSFAGPSFHARSSADSLAVFTKLSRQLSGMGYTPGASPFSSGFSPGVHSVGATSHWFVRKVSSRQAIHVRVDVDDSTVRTTLRWESRGSAWQAHSVERVALSEALDLDTWFAGLQEPNELPGRLVEEKRRYFEQKLAGMNSP